MPSPFVHTLLPPSCALYAQGRATRKERVKFAVAAVLLANIPDFDFVPATLFCEHWSDAHRHFGHNLIALSACVIFGGWLMRRWVGLAPARAWAFSFALVASHAILDGMQGHGENGLRPGVPLLWPFSEREARLPIALFRFIKVDKTENPIVTHLLSADFWGRVFLYEIVYILALFAIWAIVWRTCGAVATNWKALAPFAAHAPAKRR